MLGTNVIHIMFTQLPGSDGPLTLSEIPTEFQHLRKHLISHPGLLDLLGFSGLWALKRQLFTQSRCKRRRVYSWSRWEARRVGSIMPKPLPLLIWLLYHSFKLSLLVPFTKPLSQGHLTWMTTNSYFSVVSYKVTSLFIKKGSRGSLGPSVSIPEIVQLDRVEFHLQVSVCQNPTATPPPCDLLRILRKLAIALRNPSSSPRPWSHLDNIDRFWLQTSILPSMSC